MKESNWGILLIGKIDNYKNQKEIEILDHPFYIFSQIFIWQKFVVFFSSIIYEWELDHWLFRRDYNTLTNWVILRLTNVCNL